MKTDLDSLMREQEVDAILITGPAQHNPPMYYLTGGPHLTSAILIKKRGEEPVLFYNSMERDEATKTGLKTINLDNYYFEKLLKESNGDHLQAAILRYQKMFADLDITSGRIAVYGKVDVGPAYAVYTSLQRAMPDLTIIGEVDKSVLSHAMVTKDEIEVERIRRMGQITAGVVAEVADFLTSHKVRDNVLVKPDGNPLTIREVKKRINLWVAERDAENPEGTIFAIGRDAGVPHSTGNPKDVLESGKTIVFDIFPCEAGGGYFYDLTRTWCLGYAPDEIQEVYEDVLNVYRQIMNELKADTPCKDYQNRACELFEANGHPTIKQDPQTQEGYVHSLGHGVGLNIHERPAFGFTANEKDRLDPGVVVTIEPGLYYPDRGLGVRLEDMVWVRPDGKTEILVEYPLDLVLPVKGV